MDDFANYNNSPETDSSSCYTNFSYRLGTETDSKSCRCEKKRNSPSVQTGNDSNTTWVVTPSSTNVGGREMTKQITNSEEKCLYPTKTAGTTMTNLPDRSRLRKRKRLAQQGFLLLRSPLLIILFSISSFLISISTSTEVSSSQSQPQFSSTSNGNFNNNNLVNNVGSNNQMGNASGRNINSGIFSPNSFSSSSPSGFSPLPSSSSGGGGIHNVNANSLSVSPTEGPTTGPNTNTVYARPTAYFIAGLANQIRKINSTAMMLLTRDKPFQLQFRTVCPFGNIVYDDKFTISINSGGNMTFTTRPNEFPSSISHHTVADGRWHSITFSGDLISLDDHDFDPNSPDDSSPTPVVHWDGNSSAENEATRTTDHMLQFFDGFVGCIRVPAPIHDHSNGGRRQANVQSHEEGYLTPESPLEHQIVSLHDLFQLRTPFAPCNDTDVELSSVHSCFNPDTFVLCNKCQNGATCTPEPMSDNPMNNQCECPPNSEDIEYSGRYCEYPPPPTMPTHPEATMDISSVSDNLQPLIDTDTGLPLSAPSNIDTTLTNLSNVEALPGVRMETQTANMEIAPTTTTTTTTEAPQEFPFVLNSTTECPCRNGGECTVSAVHEGQHYCNCSTTGYEGKYCGDDVDECTKFPGICKNGICQNSPGKFECFCTPGWTGKRCSKNYDECLSNPCKHNATCHDLIDAYSCECQPGFTGYDCEQEIDECASHPCQNDGTCEDRLNDYVCHCVPGFEGKSCEIDINECLSAPCQNGGNCVDKINGFECDCNDTGFEGDLCQNNVDDCTPTACQNNGTCVDGVKDYFCECFPGYQGKSCDIDIDECAERPCQHGECYQKSNRSLYTPDTDQAIKDLLPSEFSYNTSEGYVCRCDQGFTGNNCEIDIDECALEVNPCGRNGNCKDQINGYRCECHPGFTGSKCEIEIDECESNPCVRGECIDKIGDYECRCPEGYGAKNCGTLLLGCVRDPCDKVGFAKCNAFYDEVTTNHTFNCICKESFTGRTCQLSTVMSFSGSGPIEIIRDDQHYVNGNYELNFKFRTTLPDVLLVVGSGITYFYLTLSGGKLNLQSSLLNSLEGISVGQNLSNSELHKVWISVNSTHIALAADSQQTFYPIQTEDVHTGFNVTYIGGGMANAYVNNPTKKVKKGQFIGCMQDIMINGDSEVAIPGRLNSTNIEPGCKRVDQCKPNPCQNSGNCTDLWQNFTCKCLRPYLGEKCQHEYIAATFQQEDTNNSLVRVDITPEIRNKFASAFDISMFVRTRKRNGTIFLLGNDVGGGNYSVFLEAEVGEIGNLVVHAKWSDAADDPNSKLEIYAVDGLQITDGYPHLISIQREKGLVKISVNGTEHFRKSVGNRITFTPSVLYIGGKPLLAEDPATHLETGRFIRSVVEENTETVEDITATPDSSPVTPLLSDVRMAKEASHEPTTEETTITEFVVENPFKGIIQDVRVNFSSNEVLPMILGHTHLQQHANKVQNHYVVEFYPLDVNVTYAVGEPLGTVHIQNLLKGVVSDNACRFNPCHNGGACETTWNDFKCNCADGFDGRLCEFKLPCAIMKCPGGSTCRNIGWTGFECISEVNFQGNGDVSPHYQLVSTELENITFTSISLRLRTKSIGNIVYISNGSQSFRVGLEEELDSLNQSVDALAIYIDGTRHSAKIRNLLDGQWHNVSLKLMISEKDILHLHVDSMEYKLLPPVEVGTISLDFLNDLIKSPSAELVVASQIEHRERYDVEHPEVHGNHVGHPEDAHSLFYRGCLDNIRFGEYRLPFVSPAELKYNNGNLSLATTTAPTAFYIVESSLQRGNLHLGCVVCYESDCDNGGKCTAPQDSFECHCPLGFEGSRCQTNINECLDSKCKNGATCVDGIANYTCLCPKGYEGTLCDINIDECITEDGSEPCKNGGTCVDGVASFTCICTEEYLGQHCEKRKRSTCRDGPCENGATCHDRVHPDHDKPSFRCDCAPGWEGETCSTKIDYCRDVRCGNGGSCVNKALGYECLCQPGFAGLRCETDIDECLSHPCQNNGTCQDQINGFYCICAHGFTGATCDEDIDECHHPAICPPAQDCENLYGSYTCVCPHPDMCGDECNIINPCNNLTCHNGGYCIAQCYDMDNTSWQCDCHANYGGEFCELLTMAQPAQQIDVLLIIIPVIAALLIAATIGVVILVRMARQKRATRGVYSPSSQEFNNPRVELDNVMKPPPEERLI